MKFMLLFNLEKSASLILSSVETLFHLPHDDVQRRLLQVNYIIFEIFNILFELKHPSRCDIPTSNGNEICSKPLKDIRSKKY